MRKIMIGACDLECLHGQVCKDHPSPFACSTYHLMRQEARSGAAYQKGEKSLAE